MVDPIDSNVDFNFEKFQVFTNAPYDEAMKTIVANKATMAASALTEKLVSPEGRSSRGFFQRLEGEELHCFNEAMQGIEGWPKSETIDAEFAPTVCTFRKNTIRFGASSVPLPGCAPVLVPLTEMMVVAVPLEALYNKAGKYFPHLDAIDAALETNDRSKDPKKWPAAKLQNNETCWVPHGTVVLVCTDHDIGFALIVHFMSK